MRITRCTLIRIIRQYATSYQTTAPKVCQIRSNQASTSSWSGRIITLDLWISIAIQINTNDTMTGGTLLLEDLLTGSSKTTSSRCRRCLLLSNCPAIKCGRILGNNIKAHICVLQATELCTYTLISARLIGNKPLPVVVSRYYIGLTSKGRYPEAMDHIIRIEFDLDGFTGRHMQRIGCSDIVLRIIEFPPPLMTNCSDHLCRATRLIFRCHLDQASNGEDQHHK